MKYTFTFEKTEEKKFRSTMSRLDESEYTIIEDIHLISQNEKGQKYHYPTLQTIMEMESESCLTFRMSMGNTVKIRRERTAEELAAEQDREERNTIRINVQVPMGGDQQ